jgi:hypothetical protein
LADQDERDCMAQMAREEEDRRIQAEERAVEKRAQEEEAAEKEAKKYGKKKKK